MSYADWAARWRVPLHFLVAALVLVFARPNAGGLAASAIFVAMGLGLRGWAAGHLRKPGPHSPAITTSGPYRHLRHPLYLGSLLIGAGFAVAAGRGWIALLLVGYFVCLFLPVLRREERALGEQFPDQYQRYAAVVPAWFPRLRPGTLEPASSARFSRTLYVQNREWKAPVGCAVLLVLLYLRMKGIL
jgi:protein-S-isoprenylcysteine O-methyltransferase Ste14